MGIKTSISPESRVLVVLAMIISGLAGLGGVVETGGVVDGAVVCVAVGVVTWVVAGVVVVLLPQLVTREIKLTSNTTTSAATSILLVFRVCISFFLLFSQIVMVSRHAISASR